MPGSGLGDSDHVGIDPVGQAPGDVGGDLVADVADECGDGDPGDRVAPRLPGSDGDQPGQRAR